VDTYIESAIRVLNEFTNERDLSDEDLIAKYNENQLKEAIQALLGSSITDLLKTENAISKHRVSITDLQTDLRYLVITIKRCQFRV